MISGMKFERSLWCKVVPKETVYLGIDHTTTAIYGKSTLIGCLNSSDYFQPIRALYFSMA